jgi:hypothetical protein
LLDQLVQLDLKVIVVIVVMLVPLVQPDQLVQLDRQSWLTE